MYVVVKYFSCISLYSYIKPQPIWSPNDTIYVVYLYIPTSNHNGAMPEIKAIGLYIFIFLHQTTTFYQWCNPNESCISLYSYIKPQRTPLNRSTVPSCISLYSYIKPQLPSARSYRERVVYLYIPTSNHNVGPIR